jgi:hypothetical protein
MVAWVLADEVTERFGGDRLDAMCAAHHFLRDAELPTTHGHLLGDERS